MNDTVEILVTAKKAADTANAKGMLQSSSEISRCVDCLSRLETCPFDLDLVSTHNVFKKLENLSKHKSRKICSSASRLTNVWKQRIIEKSFNVSRSSRQRRILRIKLRPKSAVESCSANVSMLPSQAPPLPQFSSPIVEKPNNDSTNVRLKTPQPSSETENVKDPSREKVRGMLQEAFSKVASEARGTILEKVSACNPVQVAAMVESVMFRQMGPCVGSQKVKYRSILFNLRDAKNPDLRRKVFCGDIKPAELINMKSEELASNQLKLEIDQMRKRAGLREETLLQQLAEYESAY